MVTHAHGGDALFAERYEVVCSIEDAGILLEAAKKAAQALLYIEAP